MIHPVLTPANARVLQVARVRLRDARHRSVGAGAGQPGEQRRRRGGRGRQRRGRRRVRAQSCSLTPARTPRGLRYCAPESSAPAVGSCQSEPDRSS